MMPPKGMSKTVSKKCPECKKAIPVATRQCHCGYQFFEERRKSTASNNSEHDDNEEIPQEARVSKRSDTDTNSSPAVEVKRRSERVKREKPNYYDSLEYDNKMRKARKERRKEEELQTGTRVKRERKIKIPSDPDDDEDDDGLKDKRKKKKKKSYNGDKKEEEIDEDLMTGITPEKEWQYSVVLADINMKLGFNNPTFSCF